MVIENDSLTSEEFRLLADAVEAEQSNARVEGWSVREDDDGQQFVNVDIECATPDGDDDIDWSHHHKGFEIPRDALSSAQVLADYKKWKQSKDWLEKYSNKKYDSVKSLRMKKKEFAAIESTIAIENVPEDSKVCLRARKDVLTRDIAKLQKEVDAHGENITNCRNEVASGWRRHLKRLFKIPRRQKSLFPDFTQINPNEQCQPQEWGTEL